MAARRTTFGKMERDRAKKAKANAKRERRFEKGTEPTDAGGDAPLDDASRTAPGGRMTEAEVIDRLRVLHDKFEDGALGFDDFEEQKAALLARLAVD